MDLSTETGTQGGDRLWEQWNPEEANIILELMELWQMQGSFYEGIKEGYARWGRFTEPQGRCVLKEARKRMGQKVLLQQAQILVPENTFVASLGNQFETRSSLSPRQELALKNLLQELS